MQANAIRDVSDTALWVAHCRAVESARPDALFRDPYAKLLAGDRGRRIADGMRSAAKYTQWTLAIRTVVIDRYIEAMVAAGVDVVLNLGAGLDSRPYRMTLPASLQWLEIDHPHIVDHKEALLAQDRPRCRLERVRLDLGDRGERRRLFADICQRSNRVLVLTEGVLPYLTEPQVSELAADLHACDRFQYWIGEYFDREVYRYINTPGRMKRMANAPFRFFPDDWLGFFAERGWDVREIRFLGEESLRLGRDIPAPWWAFVFRIFFDRERYRRFQRMMGYVLFARA